MIVLLWLVALIVFWLLLTAGPAYADARHLGASHAYAFRLALSAVLRPLAYWCQKRFQLLPAEERARLRAREAERLGLQQVDSLCCPLCGAEIQRAWVLNGSGRLAIRRGPLACPECDFRLDACRHCAHFKPESGITYSPDWSQGRCAFYKTVQPVEELCPPPVAQELQKRGYTHLPGPTRVIDSYVPVDGCSAFVLDKRRLRTSGVRPPSPRLRGLLEKANSGKAPSSADGYDSLTF